MCLLLLLLLISLNLFQQHNFPSLINREKNFTIYFGGAIQISFRSAFLMGWKIYRSRFSPVLMTSKKKSFQLEKEKRELI